jgi:drug/metabolite transporter (DMT)-like permease
VFKQARPRSGENRVAITAHPLRGMLLLALAVLVLAAMDATAKYLLRQYSVPLVMAVRYSVHCVLMAMLLLPLHGKSLLVTQRTGLVWLRAASLVVTSLFFGLALSRMPVAEATAVNFLSPMLVVLAARPILGERIGFWGWMAVIGGFVGVLLIVRPASGLDTLGVTFALCSVVANAAYQLLSRVLAGSERTLALLFYTALAGMLGFNAVLPWFGAAAMPDALQICLFLSLGVSAATGHYLFTAAYRYASASLLAPMNYLQLVWAGLLGWLVFDHRPDDVSLLGMAVVTLSGMMIVLKARRTA